MTQRDKDAVAGRIVNQLRDARFQLEHATHNANDTAALIRAVADALEGRAVYMPLSGERFRIETAVGVGVEGTWPAWSDVARLIADVDVARGSIAELEAKRLDLGL